MLLVEMGFEHWEVGFGKKMGWEMELVVVFQFTASSSSCCTAVLTDWLIILFIL